MGHLTPFERQGVYISAVGILTGLVNILHPAMSLVNVLFGLLVIFLAGFTTGAIWCRVVDRGREGR